MRLSLHDGVPVKPLHHLSSHPQTTHDILAVMPHDGTILYCSRDRDAVDLDLREWLEANGVAETAVRDVRFYQPYKP